MMQKEIVPCVCAFDMSELQAAIRNLILEERNQQHKINNLPRIGPPGTTASTYLSQRCTVADYPLTVWHVLGGKVYFEPMRVFKTQFQSSVGKGSVRRLKHRSDGLKLVHMSSAQKAEKHFSRFPEISRSPAHRTTRPLGSLKTFSPVSKKTSLYKSNSAQVAGVGAMSAPSLKAMLDCTSSNQGSPTTKFGRQQSLFPWP
ncbi:uncharacterized protein LOC108714343 [Xenopus laevis]|uniref:Uncharacterized protein LOC108714343 n=2 Tax=Xenopus laevis TaxID=8355 RepID=A0A1L8GMK7_XENLA|nr:uncharacterized protein LOC108714343 [Xenopus laevis]OCT85065.1 hypothetical protein XELAEV_18023228mg [Xenopus laevis]